MLLAFPLPDEEMIVLRGFWGQLDDQLMHLRAFNGFYVQNSIVTWSLRNPVKYEFIGCVRNSEEKQDFHYENHA